MKSSKEVANVGVTVHVHIMFMSDLSRVSYCVTQCLKSGHADMCCSVAQYLGMQDTRLICYYYDTHQCLAECTHSLTSAGRLVCFQGEVGIP